MLVEVTLDGTHFQRQVVIKKLICVSAAGEQTQYHEYLFNVYYNCVMCIVMYIGLPK